MLPRHRCQRSLQRCGARGQRLQADLLLHGCSQLSQLRAYLQHLGRLRRHHGCGHKRDHRRRCGRLGGRGLGAQRCVFGLQPQIMLLQLRESCFKRLHWCHLCCYWGHGGSLCGELCCLCGDYCLQCGHVDRWCRGWYPRPRPHWRSSQDSAAVHLSDRVEGREVRRHEVVSRTPSRVHARYVAHRLEDSLHQSFVQPCLCQIVGLARETLPEGLHVHVTDRLAIQ